MSSRTLAPTGLSYKNQSGRSAVLMAGAAAVFLTVLPHMAQAQITSREGIALQNQIMELRQQVGQAQSAGGALPAPVAAGSSAATSGGSSDLTAQLLDRVSTLEEQNREMRGQIEELTNQMKEQSASLSKQMGDMQFAMQNGKEAPAPAAKEPARAKAAETKAAPASEEAAATPEAALKAGNAALSHRDYAAAEENARQAAERGKGAVKVDGRFLLGQSLAGQKQYGPAAAAYYQAYQLAPKGTRAPEALLGVTASLIAVDKKKAACQALDKLHAEFPSPAERITKAAAIYSRRGGCS